MLRAVWRVRTHEVLVATNLTYYSSRCATDGLRAKRSYIGLQLLCETFPDASAGASRNALWDFKPAAGLVTA